ncbi:MAG: hypothetical protein KDE33_29535, partial [Bacteroidetes bacterium]|nr:hypothetical protein [Bacteroidota bacterium]
MTLTEAKIIGSRQGLISVGFGILIAQLIMTLMISTDNGFINAFFWITDIDYWINILIGIIIIFACRHFYGQLVG